MSLNIPFASFFSRLCAYALDLLIAYALPLIFLYTYFDDTLETLYRFYKEIPLWLLPTVSHCYVTLLYSYFLVKKHSTPGKMILGLEIRGPKGSLPLPQILLREVVGKQFSALTYQLGYLIALFREDHRTLHDMIAKTTVNKKLSAADSEETSNIRLKTVILLIVALLAMTKLITDFKEKIAVADTKILKNIIWGKERDTLPTSSEILKLRTSKPPKQRESIRPVEQPVDESMHSQEEAYSENSSEQESAPESEPTPPPIDQMAMAKNNPEAIKSLSDDILLNDEVLEYLANTFYKFSYHLSESQKKQPAVIKMEEKYKTKYKDSFLDYMMETKNKLEERRRDVQYLIHPDYFKDEIFITAVLNSCHSRIFSPREKLPYYNDSSVFKLEDRNVFLKKHNSRYQNIQCYPLIFENDEQFLLGFTNLPGMEHVIKAIVEKNNSPVLRKHYMDTVLRNIEYLDRETSVVLARIKEDLQVYPEIQEWVALNSPSSLRYFKSEIELAESTIDTIIKNHYNPKRFFSENQLKNKKVSEKLANVQLTPEYKETMKKRYHEQVDKFRCCGPSYGSEIKNFVATLPDEFIKDEPFQIEIIKKLRILNDYLPYLPKTQNLREKILEICKEKILHISLHGDVRQTDHQYYSQLNTECTNANIEHHRKMRGQ